MKMQDKNSSRPTAQSPKLILSFVPIIFLIISLVFVVKVFDTSVMEGASQIALLIASAVCVFIGMLFFKVPWQSFEDGIKENIANVGAAVVMLLLIGALGGTWMLSGVVPTMIYYGMQIVNPKVFLLICCIVSAVVSIVTGSSWTTIATIGVALIGIGQSYGISTSWIAGAVISGAYFGDKISPLSDTTVIASSTVGVPLFTHIRYMMITTVPAMTISLIVFLIAGFSFESGAQQDVGDFADALKSTFNITPWLMLIPLMTLLMILFKLPSLVVLFLSAVLAAAFIPVAQPHVGPHLINIGNEMTIVDTIKAMMISCYGNTSVETSNAMLTDLIATRGMSGMMNTIWLIICAMCFGGVMMASGMIANMPAAIAETNTVTGVKSLRKRLNGNRSLSRNLLNDGIYDSIPRVAEKDIQNAPSTTAPGEISRMITPANESDVNESAAYPKSIERYTNRSIRIDRVADTENPVSPR